MRKLMFVFGSHCHQPIGNFDFVFADAVSGAYEPFYRELGKHPDLKIAAHFSGCLLEWLEANEPGFLDLIAELAAAGRLELIGSGFYEPVLAAIPRADRIGQVRMMNDYLRRRFGGDTSGAWLTERVWEPQVAETLLECGLRYVVIDDFHFKCGGLKSEQLDGYYLTENDGVPLAVFPIDQRLRYTIPFHAPEESIDYLRRAYEAGKRALVMIDDGEKFGVWPGTRDLCYGERWLERFFQALSDSSDWLEMVTPREVLERLPPSGVVYLPTASYFEMGEWTLPADLAAQFAEIFHELQTGAGEFTQRFLPFMRGGIWRNFFTKYPESNNMHKRMVALSRRIESLGGKKPFKNSERLREARRELYRSQCNCAYWHGVFGGLYLPHLRDAIYRRLIMAESAADEVEFACSGPPSPSAEDLNMDGEAELILTSLEVKAIFTPRYGGALYELDYRPQAFNLLNTLAGRPEGYHQKALAAAEDAGTDSVDTPSIHDVARRVDERMRRALRYDWHNRYSLLDHCLHEDTTLDGIRDGGFRELGDFVNQPYEGEVLGERVALQRSGGLYTDEGVIPLLIRKTIALAGAVIDIEYNLANRGAQQATFIFAPEFNFSMLAGDDEELCYVGKDGALLQPGMSSEGEVFDCSEFGIDDHRKGLLIGLSLDRPATIWYTPARTVSQSESGFEMNYQSSIVIPAWRLHMQSGEQVKLGIRLALRPHV